MSQINQNTQEIDQGSDDSVNLLDYEEIESEIVTFEVVKGHEKVKMFSKYHDKLVEMLAQQDKVEIKNIFSEDSTLKIDQDLEFKLNYDTHAGTILYFMEKGEGMEVENEPNANPKYEYIGPSTRKITFGVDPTNPKLASLLEVNLEEAKKDVQGEIEIQRLDSIYNVKDRKKPKLNGEEEEDEEIFMEEEDEKQDGRANGQAVLDVNYGGLTKEDIKDMMVKETLNQRTRTGKRSAGKGPQPNLIRKKVIAEILSQKKPENSSCQE